ncbi:hypothetical protein [Synechococcus sp. PCC 6312]|uniref:hypothetical protein n=1 Tax=Synechococcus sp. (strain ATCC 27167 / PCC 6312) TaxID=195253 RepID=UPI00029F1656|nr:hypothetical protein [Synechococcus sp. PCC 6312]AFY61653.1 hypothetical protein Syn6312_2554 [Synechococcus sp. PCC 6312]
MEQLSRTPNRLILRKIPWWSWIAGTVLILGSVIPIFMFAEHKLKCQRFTGQDGYCRITSQTLLRRTSQRISLDQIQQALVRTRRGSRGRIRYQVVIQTTTGSIDFGTDIVNPADSQYLVQRLNYFLQTPTQNKFEEIQDHQVVGILFFFGLLGLGIGLLIWRGKILILDLNKQTGQLRISYWGLLGQQTKENSLRQINTVDLETHRNSKGQVTYRVSLGLYSGDKIPLRSFYGVGRKDKEETIAQIQNFLKL